VCTATASGCGAGGSCSGDYPVDCGDGTCGLSTDACLTRGDICPVAEPILCDDAEDPVCCGEYEPVCCGDGMCAGTVEACEAGEGTAGVAPVESTVPRSGGGSTTTIDKAPGSVCAVAAPGAPARGAGAALLAAALGALATRRRGRPGATCKDG